MQSVETDDILFKVLSSNKELKAALSGGIYTLGERPDDSEKEDIVINCLALTHEVPQSGTSNVNIHVPDQVLRIGGKQQRKANRERIRTLTELVLKTLKAANVEGLSFWVDSEHVIKEEPAKEHYNNLRVEWNIQLTN